MYKKGETTGSNKANRAMVAKHHLQVAPRLSKEQEELLYDPQTSGGLLLSLPASQAEDLIASMHEAGVAVAARIGEVLDESVGITIQ